MNFSRFFIVLLSMLFLTPVVYADNHDTQNIVEKAKEINKKIKEKQAKQQLSNQSKEEPLPLNDPFVGDGSLDGNSGIKMIASTDEQKKDLSVFNFKLVGVIGGQNDMWASIIDENGDILTLSMFEELAPGIKLIGINTDEIVFERDGSDSLVVINFKNQIIERAN